MQSEDGECLSPEPQAASASAAKGADDELDFEGDFPAVAGTEETVRKQEKEDGEDGEVPESESGHTEDSDLEEGELKEDEDDVAASSDVCKYYPRGSCTWGSDCRFSHQSGTASLRRNIPPLLPPPQVAPYASRGGPMSGLKATGRPYFPPGAGMGSAVPVAPDPLSSSWERGLRSAKERVAKAKERKETEVDFDDKRLNLSVPDDGSHRQTQPARHPYPSRESSSYATRDQRSSTSQHYSSSYNQSSRDYRSSHYSHQSHDESEYERRQRLAYQSAPRPEEWSDRYGRPRPPGPLLDRYGREIQRCSRPDDYVDKWKRSPVRRPEKVARDAGDLSSISTSDSPSGLSGTSDSDSDGSWSDDDRDRKRSNQRAAKAERPAPTLDPQLKPASTSGMKRIPRISERQQIRDRLSPKRVNKSESLYVAKEKVPIVGESEQTRSMRSSLSDSDHEAEYDGPKGEKRKLVQVTESDGKRRRDSQHSTNGPASPIARPSASPRRPSTSSSDSSSPKREKDKFVMDFVGKSQRIKPNEVADTLNHDSSDDDSGDGSAHRAVNEEENAVDKAAERKKLLEQLKAVEAAIAAKKQPLRQQRRKL